MWGTRDEFHFAWRRLEGDFILQARVEFLGQGVDPHRKAGWIVRSSLDADATYVDGAVHGDGLTSLQFRKEKGGKTEQIESASKGSDVIQLERRGNTLHFLRRALRRAVHDARDRGLRSRAATPTSACSCARTTRSVIEQAIFRNVRIIRPAKADFVPYRDYIGSQLELLDVQTGIARSSTTRTCRSRRRTGRPTARRSTSTPVARTRHARPPLSVRPRDAPAHAHRHGLRESSTTTITCSPSTARCSASATRARTRASPRSSRCRHAAACRNASRRSRRRTCTAGRRMANSCSTPAGASGEFDIYKIASDGSGKEIR